MQNRTDLAVESYEEKNKTKINGVIVKEGNGITYVKVTNENGVQQIGKPIGEYITVEVPSFVNDTDIFDGRRNIKKFASPRLRQCSCSRSW